MENELVQVFFDPSKENIDWVKRQTSKIIQSNTCLNKLEENMTFHDASNIINEKTNSTNICESKDSGQTQRGIEIQRELANLREETKRKDLNSSEKQNLTNILIKLQNEIISNIEKFSKFDSIPVRLNQIENYLEKLKYKKNAIQESAVLAKKTNIEEKQESESEKKKMQVIWKFGL